MFKKILIANRGEIAVRVLRACREMGIPSVAIYSEADRESLHVRWADEAVCVGPAPALESYLNQKAVLSAAELTGAEAIHPGYGFLSENAGFARRCREAGFCWIGPNPDAVEKVGDKSVARRIAQEAGVPVVPGSPRCLRGDSQKLKTLGGSIGYPLLIKAVAGGGGKGMRIIQRSEDLMPGLLAAQREAQAAFGDDSVYLEKLVERPRHVEIQIAGDEKGNLAAFPERDCTIQRRHQKLVEESPSPAVSVSLRERLMGAALKIARAVNYTNLGTVEFLLDADGNFYFIEVNARLQVEHPVTEQVTGLDLVQEQIRLAAGERLSFTQERAQKILGHAVEHRINAENPEANFAPSPGRVTVWTVPGGPGGLRVLRILA